MRVKIAGIPSEVNVWWILVSIVLEGSNTILEVKRSRRENWVGVSVGMRLHIKPEEIHKSPDLLRLLGGEELHVIVEDRRPRCHRCGETAI